MSNADTPKTLSQVRLSKASECIEKWLNERKGPFYNHATYEMREGFLVGFDCADNLWRERVRGLVEALKMVEVNMRVRNADRGCWAIEKSVKEALTDFEAWLKEEG